MAATRLCTSIQSQTCAVVVGDTRRGIASVSKQGTMGVSQLWNWALGSVPTTIFGGNLQGFVHMANPLSRLGQSQKLNNPPTPLLVIAHPSPSLCPVLTQKINRSESIVFAAPLTVDCLPPSHPVFGRGAPRNLCARPVGATI